MQVDLAAAKSSSPMRAYAPRALARSPSAICSGCEDSNRVKPAGTPWAKAGATGIADVSAMNAIDPQIKLNTRACPTCANSGREELMLFMLVMMISFR
jgi:hypothetical protein